MILTDQQYEAIVRNALASVGLRLDGLGVTMADVEGVDVQPWPSGRRVRLDLVDGRRITIESLR